MGTTFSEYMYAKSLSELRTVTEIQRNNHQGIAG